MTSAEDGAVGQGALPVSLSLASFAESKEGMAAPWFADLVRGGDIAEGLSEPLRGALCLLTIELAEAQGIERQRDEARQREVEATRQLEEAREREFMLAELRVVLHAKDGDEPELSATSIANSMPAKWVALSQFLDRNMGGFKDWVGESEGAEVLAALDAAVRNQTFVSAVRGDRVGSSWYLEAFLVEFYLAFSDDPVPVFQGCVLDRATLATVARRVVPWLDASELYLPGNEAQKAERDFVVALFETRALTRFSVLPGYADLLDADSNWQSWFADFKASSSTSLDDDHGLVGTLLVAVDAAARDEVRQRALDIASLGVQSRAPAGLLARAGRSPGFDVAMDHYRRRIRDELGRELLAKLGSRSRRVENLPLHLRGLQQWLRNESNAQLVLLYLRFADESKEDRASVEQLIAAAKQG